jgi:hypothetical protein
VTPRGFVSFVWFVLFISFGTPNEPDKINQPKKPDEPNSRHAPRLGLQPLFGSVAFTIIVEIPHTASRFMEFFRVSFQLGSKSKTFCSRKLRWRQI